MQRGAKVSHVDNIEGGLKILRDGTGADLVMIDIRQPVARFMKQMKQDILSPPLNQGLLPVRRERGRGIQKVQQPQIPQLHTPVCLST